MGQNFILVTTFVTIVLVLSINYCNGQCSGSSLSLTADTSYQFIESTNYPGHYLNNENCEWTITASSLPYVLIFVEYKSIESYYDRLLIYSGSSFSMYSSESYQIPVILVSTDNYVTVTFSSDSSITYGGFRMSYMEVGAVDACGASLTATTTPQRLVYSYGRYSSTCTYTISSSALVKFTLNLVSGYLAYNDGTYNTVSTVNSTVVTSSNTVTIYGVYGRDFVITYEEVTSGTGSIVTTSASPYTYWECTSHASLSADSSLQYYSSDNYPSPYSNYAFCTALITATDTTKAILINITDYNVAYGDGLTIYDGPTTSYDPHYSFITGSTFLSTGYRVFIRFTSNSYGQARGFRLSFTTATRENPENVVTYTLTGSYNATNSIQTITSPNYPSNYDNNLEEYWLIRKPNQDDLITLDFTECKIELNDGCTYDWVSIYDGYLTSSPLLATFCGYDPVTFQDRSGLYILVRFRTDVSIVKKGFSLNFYIGEFNDPDAGASTSDDGGIPDYVYPIIAIAVIILISVIVFICFVNRHKRRVAAGKEMPPKPKLKKRTTQQLLDELNSRYGSKLEESKRKQAKKQANYHPKPHTTGPNVNIIHMGGTSPHPPPMPPPSTDDPAYPPPYIGTGTDMPQGNLAPVLTNHSQMNPSVPVAPMSNQGSLPGPFTYISPAEARASGTYASNA
ncbi:hypothetical protein ACF0H5_010536 [Mactra antiquata]